MSFLRIALIVAVTALTIGLVASNSAQAQNFTTYDGARFIDQSPETQSLFVATWGPRAEEMWSYEHNAQLVAMGFPIPQPQVAAAPVNVSGAQVADDNENDNEEEDDDDNDNQSGAQAADDNDNDDDDDTNDNE
jgi:hypothetical protein